MTIFNPKVSIIIPVYNGSNYLREAIDSALAQTYTNIEVVVVNDGSSDKGKTESIALSYGNKIKYFSKPNGGVATALNVGIEKMTGDYFSWLSHDDMYAPQKIEKQVAALSFETNHLAIAFCDFYSIDTEGTITKECKVSKKAVQSIKCFLATDVITGIHGCSLLIPRTLFKQYGTFNPELKCTQDYDMWFRFAEQVPFVHVEEMLVISRQHPEQDSKNKLELCLKEADSLHGRVISTLTEQEVRAFSGESIEYFINVYEIYKNAGYKKTSLSLLRLIVKFASLPQEIAIAAEILRTDLLQVDSDKNEEILELLLTGIRPLLQSSAMPTLVFYNNVWWRGGVERVVADITGGLANQYNIVLITLDIQKGSSLPLHPSVLHIRMRESENYIDRLVNLCVLLETNIFIGNPNFILEFLSIYAILNSLNIKTIACSHAYYFLPFWNKWLYKSYEARINAFKKANVVTWLTNFSTNTYRITNDNGACMPNPLSLHSLPVYRCEKDEKIVLCVGRFYDSIKRIDRILKIFYKVLHYHPDAKLYIVGGYDLDMYIPEDSQENVGEIINRLGLNQSQVVFLGEQDNVNQYYEKARLLILTSDSEGFGVVLTEAGAHGLPSIIFDVPGLEDIISDGENGYIVPQDDIDGAAKKVVLLLENKELCQAMGEKARVFVERFNRDKIVARWAQLIKTVLESDSQEKLNKILKQEFVAPAKDQESFFRRVVTEYDKHVISIFNHSFPEDQDDSLLARNSVLVSENANLKKRYLENFRESIVGRILRKMKKVIKAVAISGCI